MGILERLNEINSINSRGDLTDFDRVALGVEKIWIEFKIGNINQDQRIKSLNELLEEVEKKSPDAYSELTRTGNTGVNQLHRIANEVLKRK